MDTDPLDQRPIASSPQPVSPVRSRRWKKIARGFVSACLAIFVLFSFVFHPYVGTNSAIMAIPTAIIYAVLKVKNRALALKDLIIVVVVIGIAAGRIGSHQEKYFSRPDLTDAQRDACLIIPIHRIIRMMSPSEKRGPETIDRTAGTTSVQSCR